LPYLAYIVIEDCEFDEIIGIYLLDFIECEQGVRVNIKWMISGRLFDMFGFIQRREKIFQEMYFVQ